MRLNHLLGFSLNRDDLVRVKGSIGVVINAAGMFGLQSIAINNVQVNELGAIILVISISIFLRTFDLNIHMAITPLLARSIPGTPEDLVYTHALLASFVLSLVGGLSAVVVTLALRSAIPLDSYGYGLYFIAFAIPVLMSITNMVSARSEARLEQNPLLAGRILGIIFAIIICYLLRQNLGAFLLPVGIVISLSSACLLMVFNEIFSTDYRLVPKFSLPLVLQISMESLKVQTSQIFAPATDLIVKSALASVSGLSNLPWFELANKLVISLRMFLAGAGQAALALHARKVNNIQHSLKKSTALSLIGYSISITVWIFLTNTVVNVEKTVSVAIGFLLLSSGWMFHASSIEIYYSNVANRRHRENFQNHLFTSLVLVLGIWIAVTGSSTLGVIAALCISLIIGGAHLHSCQKSRRQSSEYAVSVRRRLGNAPSLLCALIVTAVYIGSAIYTSNIVEESTIVKTINLSVALFCTALVMVQILQTTKSYYVSEV